MCKGENIAQARLGDIYEFLARKTLFNGDKCIESSDPWYIVAFSVIRKIGPVRGWPKMDEDGEESASTRCIHSTVVPSRILDVIDFYVSLNGRQITVLADNEKFGMTNWKVFFFALGLRNYFCLLKDKWFKYFGKFVAFPNIDRFGEKGILSRQI